MSSSSSAPARVWRRDSGRVAEVLDLQAPRASKSARPSLADPFAAERAAAYQEGYDAAVAESTSRDEAAKAARAERLADALVAAAAAAREHREIAVAEASREAIELAFEMAEAILERESEVRGSLTLDALRRALALVPKGEDLIVRIHPDDVIAPEELQELTRDASVRVVPDPSIEAGGCVVEAGPCRIDAQLGPSLARARALLGAPSHESAGAS